MRCAPLRGGLWKSEPKFESGLSDPLPSNNQLTAFCVDADDKLQRQADLVPARGVRLIDAGAYEDLLQNHLTELLICGDLVIHVVRPSPL